VKPGKRRFDLVIWALGFGYFVFYTPYSGLTKAITSGLLLKTGPISGFELLPISAVAPRLPGCLASSASWDGGSTPAAATCSA